MTSFTSSEKSFEPQRHRDTESAPGCVHLAHTGKTGVHAAQMMDADGQHVTHDPDAVADRTDLRTVVMRPLDRDFCNCEVQSTREEEHLRVPAPAIDMRHREDGLGCLAGECLEAALRVVQSQTQQQTIKEVEDT